MSKKVLVAYASKYGATEQIAEKIALRLKKAGLNVIVQPVKTVTSVIGYDAVVLGSGVYAGFWIRAASDFLKQQEAALTGIPVWLFSDGPTGEGNPKELMEGFILPENLKPLAERIAPRDIAFFHGVINMKKLRFAEKLIIRALKAPTGDFRDWDMINDWVDRVASALK
jgi:menaquinone-dependent protoporphyrinogen oxidase